MTNGCSLLMNAPVTTAAAPGAAAERPLPCALPRPLRFRRSFPPAHPHSGHLRGTSHTPAVRQRRRVCVRLEPLGPMLLLLLQRDGGRCWQQRQPQPRPEASFRQRCNITVPAQQQRRSQPWGHSSWPARGRVDLQARRGAVLAHEGAPPAARATARGAVAFVAGRRPWNTAAREAAAERWRPGRGPRWKFRDAAAAAACDTCVCRCLALSDMHWRVG